MDGVEPNGVETRWTGELTTGYLPSGSTRIVVDVERARVGEPVVATIVFGEGDAPAPPADADVGWPMGVDPDQASVPVADGYVYHSLDGRRIGDAIDVDIAITDLWEPWCALQTPHRISDTSDDAQCLPNRPWTASPFECQIEGDEENPDMLVDCLKLTLCRRTRVCECTTTDGCSVSRTGLRMELDLRFSGDTAEGTLLWISEDSDVGSQTARVSLTRS